jgi:hypothetical protein
VLDAIIPDCPVIEAIAGFQYKLDGPDISAAIDDPMAALLGSTSIFVNW